MILKLVLNPNYNQVLGELSRPVSMVSTGSTLGQAERTRVLLCQLQRKPEKGSHQVCARKGILFVLHDVLNSVIDFKVMKR